MLLARFKLQPREERAFYVDYTGRLPEGQTLSGVSVSQTEPETDPEFYMNAGTDETNLYVMLFGGGGISGLTYKVTLEVYTDQTGEIWEDELEFICEEI